MSLPSSAYVILGKLKVLGGASGYDVKRDADSTLRAFWTISQAQIYPLLASLERDGLVEGRSEPRGRRRRRVFTLTDDGEEVLRDWLRTDEPLSYELRDAGMLKLFFADVLDREDALALVRRIRARHERMLERVKKMEPRGIKAAEAGVVFPLHTLRWGFAIHEATLAYCAALEAELEKRSARRRAR
jgi:PadR family transcriptional regulator, regulatory protein AphA